MRRLPAIVFITALYALSASQPFLWPTTKAESTNFEQTSTYQEVVSFIEELQRLGAPYRLEYIGESEKGKRIPMVVVADSLVGNPSDARRSGKAIVYIQANIHGGEVEGKEASLQLMREIAIMLDTRKKGHTLSTEQQRLAGILQGAILLFCPIYNIDGNDDFGDGMRNRGSQDGPAIVGTRANGQGFDLNRDCIKAESHEMQAVLRNVYTTWDPDVIMDLHTTNGTRHGYQLTYSPPLSPITDPGILDYSRDELLPKVRADVRNAFGFQLFDYGNVTRRGEVRRWETFGVEARYVTTYAGLRNRIGVLSEATSYLPFAERVIATHSFVLSILTHVAHDYKKIVELTRSADERMTRLGMDAKAGQSVELGVRFEMAGRGTEEVILEVAQPAVSVARNKAPKELESVSMEIFDRFQPTRTAKLPGGYLLPSGSDEAIALLLKHGVIVERVIDQAIVLVERFAVTESVVSAQPFQGRRLTRLEGEFQKAELQIDRGWYYVDTAQPLGALAFYMLEPEGLDGVIAWGFVSPPEPNSIAPIYKTFAPINVARERVKSVQE
jgi:hypothetical protein